MRLKFLIVIVLIVWGVGDELMAERRFPTPPWSNRGIGRLFCATVLQSNFRKQGKQMPAYLIAEHIITDEAKFHEYRTKVEPMMAKHGGRYLTKGAAHKLPEGGHWKPERVVIIEFPDMNSLDAWYKSPEYQPLIALRKSCTSDQDMVFVLEGA